MSSSPSKRRTFEVAKDNTLAQWTTEIRKLQSEVDQEEEEESRRLQEEIAASRLERERRRASNRRSAGIGLQNPSGVTMSDSPIAEDSPTDMQSIIDRQKSHSDALNRLVGGDTIKLQASKAEPQSLASIFGSKATGPRLNRHAPQVDLSDQPTKVGASFMQDPSIRLGAGVALPGLRGPSKQGDLPSQSTSGVTSYQDSAIWPTSSVSIDSDKQKDGETSKATVSPKIFEDAAGSNPRESSVKTPVTAPPQATSFASIFGSTSTGPRLNKPAAQADVSAQPDRISASFIQNDLTRPGGSLIPESPSFQRSHSSNSPQTYKVDSPMLPHRSTTLPPSRNEGGLNTQQASSDSQRVVLNEDEPNGTSLLSSPRPTTPQTSPDPSRRGGYPNPRTNLTSGGTPPPGPHRIVSPPALARPIQPSPSTPNKVFQIPQSSKVSPAFLRPLPTKELTPSLTRLQGRGFVAKSVHAVVSTQAPNATETKPAKPGGMVASTSGKKPSVLDRWPGAAASGNASPDRPSDRASPLKNRVFPASASTPIIIRPAVTPSTSASSVRAVDAEAKSVPAIALPGLAVGNSMPSMPSKLASLSTEFSKAKPSEHPAIQELSAQKVTKTVTLSHPTRERARKPRKAAGTLGNSGPYQASFSTEDPEKEPLPLPTAPTQVIKPLEPFKPESVNVSVPVPVSSPVATPSLSGILTSPNNVVNPNFQSEGRSASPAQRAKEPAQGAQSVPVASRVGRLPETWSSNPPITQRDTPIFKTRDTSVAHLPFSRQALPGMTPSGIADRAPASKATPSPTPESSNTMPPVSNADQVEEPAATPVDVRSAIANWGKSSTEPTSPYDKRPLRATSSTKLEEERDEKPTVVDVRNASTMWSQELPSTNSPSLTSAQSPPTLNQEAVILPATSQRDPVKAERRRSNLHEKYASIILPSLTEVETPNATPVGSIVARRDTSVNEVVSVDGRGQPEGEIEIMHQALLDHKALVELVGTDSSPLPPPASLPGSGIEPVVTLPKKDDGPTPSIELSSIGRATQLLSLPSNAITTSVDVLLVSGNSTSSIGDHPHIFYDVEVRAIVHRFKSSGLVTTRVFGWRGRQAEVGAAEAKKLGELAARYGAELTPCIQGSEPADVVKILGGVLITRQGPRSHWSVENTAMHCVREVETVIYIDQVEPERRNLCSAFSYVSTMIGSVYVFHGRGSSEAERAQSRKYADSLALPGVTPVVFEEGQEDEMFAMMLGEENHAMADFWKYRNLVDDCLANLYRVDNRMSPPIQQLGEVAAECIDPAAVFVLDGTFELFVLVGSDARGSRNDIRTALALAEALASTRANKLPMKPPTHVLILPTQIPMDLRVGHVRFMDEELLNGGEIPDHMNLLPYSLAVAHLSTWSWPKSSLDDASFLPLGVAPDDVPAF